MPEVVLEQATIDYRVLGPEDSPHPPVLFVHGILVDHRLWVEVAEDWRGRDFVASCRTGPSAHTPSRSTTAPTFRHAESPK